METQENIRRKNLYSEPESVVKIEFKKKSKWFRIEKGARQG